MKKALLSLLMLLYFHPALFACEDFTSYNHCIKKRQLPDGSWQQYISMDVGCYNPGSQPAYIWYTIGSTTYGPLSPSVQTNTGFNSYYLEFITSPQIPPYICVDLYVEDHSTTPTTPSTNLITLCPCDLEEPPCDANFKYCVSSSNPYLFTFTPFVTDMWVSGYSIDFGDGSSCNLCTPPFTHTYAPGSYKVCMRVYYWGTGQYYCDKCVWICIPDKIITTRMAGEESPIIEDIIENTSQIELYPNPTSGISLLKFGLENASNVNIELIDATGRVVSNIRNEKMDKGLHTIEINVDNIATGIYIVRVQVGNAVSNHRLSVIK